MIRKNMGIRNYGFPRKFGRDYPKYRGSMNYRNMQKSLTESYKKHVNNQKLEDRLIRIGGE